MIGVLYVFHGSQKAEKNQAAISFIQSLEKKHYQEIAFLENHSDSIFNQAEKLIESGVDQLIVVPVLLFAAKHALVDIPEELVVFKQQFPNVTIFQTETIGGKAGSRAVLLERFQEAAAKSTTTDLKGFLVAHGTKKTNEPQKILEEIAKEIQSEVGFPIFAANLMGNENYLSVIRENATSVDQLIVVPFFLFEGHLTDNMKVKLAQTITETPLMITKTLEFDPRILPDLEKMIEEAILCIQSC